MVRVLMFEGRFGIEQKHDDFGKANGANAVACGELLGQFVDLGFAAQTAVS